MTSTSGSACPEKFHPHVYFLFSLNYLFQSGYSLGCRHPPATSTALMARIQNICIFIKNIHIFIKNGKNAKYLHFHIFINNGKNTKYMSFDGSLTFTFNFKDVAKVMCKILGTYSTNANNYPYKYYKHMQTNTD